MKTRAVKFHVKGKVQGVWFRMGTLKTAQRLNVNGYVRNLPNSQVECYAIGDFDAVQALIEWAHNGTPFARVDSVEVIELDEWEEFTKFQIHM